MFIGSTLVGGGLRLGLDAVALGQRAGARATLAALDIVLESELAEEAVDRVLGSPLARLTIAHALDEVIPRVRENEELWRLVDEVARSPAVTAVVTQQSLSFADQVAGEVRVRSRSADALVERTGRRLLRRPKMS